MEMTTDFSQQMSTRISPHLIAANHILELSNMELQQALQQEIYENPALEMVERTTCPKCGNVMIDTVCYHCLTAAPGSAPIATDPGELYLDGPGYNAGSGRDEDFDPITLVAAPMTLGERLLSDLRALLVDSSQYVVAEYLVGNLDDNGWLRLSIEECAEALDTDPSVVEYVLSMLQTLEPAGIGARDLRECLLIQIAYLASQGIVCPYVQEIVADHFAELGEHKYKRIAHTLHAPIEAITEASAFIKNYLNPFPAQEAGARSRSAPSDTPRYVLPDVIISRGETGLEVEVIESKRFILRINPQYQQIWNELERETANADGSGSIANDISRQDREHVRQYISRARMFMANLNQRRQTMLKIGTFLAEYQTEFLEQGIRYLRPLTRAMVAAATGMHESTVSRATAGKFVMIPSGQVIPFSDFFTAALNVKDVIKEMVDAELAPLTDQDIVERLKDQGYVIARRTVAKYREQMGILPSSLRR